VGTDRHGLTDAADVGAFLSRLVRLDPAAVVRLRPAEAPGRVTLWGRVPWGVLVARTVAGTVAEDATVVAQALLDEVAAGGPTLPPRRDGDWRWPLPTAAGRVVQAVPVTEVRRIAAAAAGTLRTAVAQGVGGRAVGQRALRDALLDHVSIVVDVPGRAPVDVPQRLVQAVVRMGFLGSDELESDGTTDVRVSGRWVGLSAPYGVSWLPPVTNFALRPAGPPPNG
jgi:hypothetical protein